MIAPLGFVWLAVLGCEREFAIQTLPPPSGDLTVSGRACDPTTLTWIDGALVYTHLYDSQDVVWDSRSDQTGPDGAWALPDLAPRLDYEVYVQVGQEIVDRFVVELGDEDLVVAPPPCTDPVERPVAAVTDDPDGLGAVLDAVDLVGAEIVDGQGDGPVTFLADLDAMRRFEVIVLDGGMRERGVLYGVGPVDVVLENLRTWVAGGGVLLVTDWAYDAVERAWPDRVDFFGDDALPEAAQVGETGLLAAQVVDGPLALATGLDAVAIVYDLPVWPLVDGVGDGVTVYLTGDAPWRLGQQVGTSAEAPLVVGFAEGEGRVVVSTWRPAANDDPGPLEILRSLLAP